MMPVAELENRSKKRFGGEVNGVQIWALNMFSKGAFMVSN